MKKAFLFMLLAFVTLQNICAQEPEQVTKPAQNVDSLLQVVNALSSKMEATEAKALDKKIWKDRAKYFNIGYIKQNLSETGGDEFKLKSEFGASISMGRTYYLHKKPLLGMIKIGLDWSWIDMSFAKYSTIDLENSLGTRSIWDGNDYDEDEDYDEDLDLDLELGCFQLETGMSVGPSVTINPINHLKVNAYFHFTPSASMIFLDDNISASYASFFNIGAAVSYKFISIGVEKRWGSANYSSLSLDDIDLEEDLDLETDLFLSSKKKMKTSGLRAYISFRY